MKKWIIGLMMALIVTTGMAFPVHVSTVSETPVYELHISGYMESSDFFVPNEIKVFEPIEIGFFPDTYSKLTTAKGGVNWVNESTLKVPIYSVPLPNENKIVLVKDPKGFVERAIRHNMEFLAIKPSDKGEYWELMPVFANEPGALSFDLKKSKTSEEGETEEEPLRIVPVKDFIRYN